MKNTLKQAGHLFAKDLKDYKYGIVLAIAIWAFFSIVFGTPCLAVLLFGMPCPFCGLTRAMWYCLQFRFADAFAVHPFWPLVPIGGILFVLYRYFRCFKVSVFYIYFLFFCVTLTGLYVYRLATQFPGPEPMVYTSPNALSILLDIIGKTQ